MKLKLTDEKIFDIFLLSVICFMVYQAWGFPFRARLMPLLAGIPAAVLMGLIIIKGFFIKPEGDSKPLTDEEKKRQKTIFLCIFALLVLLTLFGLNIGLGIALFLYVWFVAEWKFWQSALMGGGMYLLIYLLFDRLMSFRLYKGYVYEEFLWQYFR